MIDDFSSASGDDVADMDVLYDPANDDVIGSDVTYSDTEMEQENDVPIAANVRPQRQAAVQAIERIQEQTVEESLTDEGYFQGRDQLLVIGFFKCFHVFFNSKLP